MLLLARLSRACHIDGRLADFIKPHNPTLVLFEATGGWEMNAVRHDGRPLQSHHPDVLPAAPAGRKTQQGGQDRLHAQGPCHPQCHDEESNLLATNVISKNKNYHSMIT